MNSESEFLAEHQFVLVGVCRARNTNSSRKLMIAIPQKLAHSANVQMRLLVDGQVLSIGQLRIGFLMVDNPINHPASNAIIQMNIDGDERSWAVFLPDGIDTARPQTRFCSTNDSSPATLDHTILV